MRMPEGQDRHRLWSLVGRCRASQLLHVGESMFFATFPDLQSLENIESEAFRHLRPPDAIFEPWDRLKNYSG